ncbi:hypothetical protein VP382E491_P0098 [Vibrio phage 382E49-1]|nr:hypothetical protein VP382E491_P0098 [Vibrio phage 382E49-1]
MPEATHIATDYVTNGASLDALLAMWSGTCPVCQ